MKRLRLGPIGYSLLIGVGIAIVACGKGNASGVDGGDGTDGTTAGTTGGDTAGTTAGTTDGTTAGFDTLDGGPGPLVDAATGVVIDAGALGPCKAGTTQCTNCVDDDGDGKPDWLDPDCTGPLDNDESSFATGIPGDNVDPCRQDCFFDGNSGSGDDKCLNNLKCDPKSPGGEKCPYDPAFKNCDPVTQACLNFCKPLVPNGCDCFGCCALPSKNGGTVTVSLTPTCSADKADDPVACPRCTQATSCVNKCETCELCVGKTTLPAECGSGGTTSGSTTGTTSGTSDGGTAPLPVCSSGAQACDATHPCAPGDYCLTGCCIAAIR